MRKSKVPGDTKGEEGDQFLIFTEGAYVFDNQSLTVPSDDLTSLHKEMSRNWTQGIPKLHTQIDKYRCNN